MKNNIGKTKHVILAIAIAILFLLFVAYAIQTFYPEPTRTNLNWGLYEARGECEGAGGEWVSVDDKIPVASENVDEPEIPRGYCYLQDKVIERYNRNVFFISLIVGIITIVVGVLLSMEAVSAGFMGGGVLLVVYGTIRYWGSLSDVFRTIMLGLALVVLVWIGYKKLG